MDEAQERIAVALLSALRALHEEGGGGGTEHHEGICSGLAIALALTVPESADAHCVSELQSRGLDMLNQALAEQAAESMAEELVGEIEDLLRRHP